MIRNPSRRYHHRPRRHRRILVLLLFRLMPMPMPMPTLMPTPSLWSEEAGYQAEAEKIETASWPSRTVDPSSSSEEVAAAAAGWRGTCSQPRDPTEVAVVRWEGTGLVHCSGSWEEVLGCPVSAVGG